MVHQVARILLVVAQIWVLCAIARALLSWFPISYDSPLRRVNAVLVAITEPVIAPVRRVVPPLRAGGVAIDLSFFVAIILVEIVVSILSRIAS